MTVAEVYYRILNEPGITYKRLTRFFKEQFLHEAINNLLANRQIVVVKYTMWSIHADSFYSYYPIDKGSLKVIANEQLIEYDPHDTLKRALDDA